MSSPRISINLIGYNHQPEDIAKCIDAVLAQQYQNFELTFSDNGSKNGLFESISQKYSGRPNFRAVDNKANLGYAAGHNKFFDETDSELLMVLNPDAILHPGFLENISKAFNDPKVAAATGKMIKPQSEPGSNSGELILDGTGVVIGRTRRAQERGQLEVDHGQYDQQRRVFGVSGSAAVYRKSALAQAKVLNEYFDTDFFMYWEDIDLAWRLRLLGFECVYVPEAVVEHSRVAGKTQRGYKDPIAFAKHHAKFSLNIRRWNWRNHLFMIIKNDFGWNLWKGLPFIILRETAMLGYIVVFEPRTLGAVPVFFRLLPNILKKRKLIQQKRVVSSKEISKWFK